MYLSRLVLNPRSPAVRRDLADCHAMHRTVMSGFLSFQIDGDARAALGVLHRVETDPRSGRVTLLVQSRVEPDWSRLEGGYLTDDHGADINPACKRIDLQYQAIGAGKVLAFRLRANPTRKIDTKSGPDGSRRNGRRVELSRETDQIAWLRRKGEQGGFRLLSVRVDSAVANVRVVPGVKAVGSRGCGGAQRLVFGTTLFEGVLQVEDAERFRRTLECGVGPGKAYGFGLLSVASLEG